MEKELIFVGFKSGIGKSNKQYHMLNFITPPIVSNDGCLAFINNISLFTTEEKYQSFIKENNLLDNVLIPYEVFGDKVRYYL